MIKHWKKLLAATLLVGNLFVLPTADAATDDYAGAGADIEYVSQGESPDVAKLRAQHEALTGALEQVAESLKSYSISAGTELTDDEIAAIVANAYKLDAQAEVKHVDGDIWRAFVGIRVDYGEVANWLKFDEGKRMYYINQLREMRKLADVAADFPSNQKVAEGTQQLYRDKFDEAIKLYTEAINLKSDNAAAYNARGYAYAEFAKSKLIAKDTAAAKELRTRALADFNRAIQLKPDYSDAYCNLGNLHRDTEEYSTALADYTKAVETDSNNAYAYELRADLYRLELKDYSRAVDDYTRAIELSTQDKEHLLAIYYRFRGESYRNLNRCDEAIADYSKAIELMPPYYMSTKVYYRWTFSSRADCYEAVGDTARAKADRQKFDELK